VGAFMAARALLSLPPTKGLLYGPQQHPLSQMSQVSHLPLQPLIPQTSRILTHKKPTCERAVECGFIQHVPAPTFLSKKRQQAGCCGVGQAQYERGGKGDCDQRSRGQGDRGAEADGHCEMIGLGRGVEVHGLDDAAVVDHGNDTVEQADDDERDKPAAEQ
jgi:hypothetical protein